MLSHVPQPCITCCVSKLPEAGDTDYKSPLLPPPPGGGGVRVLFWKLFSSETQQCSPHPPRAPQP